MSRGLELESSLGTDLAVLRNPRITIKYLYSLRTFKFPGVGSNANIDSPTSNWEQINRGVIYIQSRSKLLDDFEEVDRPLLDPEMEKQSLMYES
jgi:hypothetical protein